MSTQVAVRESANLVDKAGDALKSVDLRTVKGPQRDAIKAARAGLDTVKRELRIAQD